MNIESADNSKQEHKKAALHAEHILQSTLDALSSHIAILNERGEIIAVNKAWRHFSKNNQGSVICCDVGDNYLEACHSANDRMQKAAREIQKVLSDQEEEFRFEYACNISPRARWFNIHVTRFVEGKGIYLVVAHEDVTENKKYAATNRIFTTLSQMTKAIIQTSDHDGFFQQVCRIFVEQGEFSVACINWHDQDSRQLEPVAGWAREGMYFHGLRDILVEIQRKVYHPGIKEFEERHPYVCNDCSCESVFEALEGNENQLLHACAIMPIIFNDQLQGALTVYAEETDFFQDREVELLEEAATNISYALNIFQLEESHLRSEAELRKIHEELETRVVQRTAQLQRVNASLQDEIAERMESEAEALMRKLQQEAVTTIGQQALANVDIEMLMQNITDYLVSTMEVDLSSLIEWMPDQNYRKFRAATGWKTDMRNVTLPHEPDSHISYALSQSVPVIISNLEKETRFKTSPHFIKEGIVSGVIVVVGGGRSPFGILGAFTTKSRLFTNDDIYIMQNMAHILSSAMEQQRISYEMNELNKHLQEVNEQLKIRNEERSTTLQALEESAQVLEQAKAEADMARLNAEYANRTKDEFLSRMSHELRTPLNAILGFGQILDEQELTPLQKESIKYIIKGGRHLLNLVNDILDIARIEAGRFDLSIEPIHLDDLLEGACALIGPLAKDNKVHVHQDLSAYPNCYVMADKRQLKQVVINLISNAIKYNRPEGDVIISWELTHSEKIRISVRDTGYGIASEDLAKLFMPFERLGAASTDVEGTGLGLALSQQLLKAMGSELFAESILDEGSTFYFDLPPATAPEDILADLVPMKTIPESPSGRKYEVLLIEDNLSNLRLIEMILESRPGVSLVSALQGSIGLDMARQHEPDLILLDLHLPDMSGQQVLAHLKRSAITRDIPVVVISADATPSRIQRLLDVGIMAYLTKPLDVLDFLNILDEAFRKQDNDPPRKGELK